MSLVEAFLHFFCLSLARSEYLVPKEEIFGHVGVLRGDFLFFTCASDQFKRTDNQAVANHGGVPVLVVVLL